MVVEQGRYQLGLSYVDFGLGSLPQISVDPRMKQEGGFLLLGVRSCSDSDSILGSAPTLVVPRSPIS